MRRYRRICTSRRPSGVHHKYLPDQKKCGEATGTVLMGYKRLWLRKWRPPSRGTIKLNTDAAFSQNLERTGIGVVARNAEGELMKVWARAELKRSEPQVEEAAAIRMGMQMAWKANWRAVELQSDCKEVVDMINKKQKQQNNIVVILEDIANMRCLFELSLLCIEMGIDVHIV
nr:uncharacterized protein LOC113728530 [Coffea arabica]